MQIMLFYSLWEVNMQSRNIEIRKVTFNKFEFVVKQDEKTTNEDGKATISMNLLDREEGQENQIILMKMEVSYPDPQYKVIAEIESAYSVLVSDLPKDILADIEFQQALLAPMVEKLRIYIGLFSEGAYGAIQIPNLNFNQD